MRPIKDTISLEDARTIVHESLTRIERIERVVLSEANGRVLAADVVSNRDVPPFARAAMDGYAVVAEDTFGASRGEPVSLRRIARLYTGQTSSRHVARGECIEIATGAPMPAGADAVVMVEETESTSGDEVRILSPVHPRQHVGPQGADIRTGQSVIARDEQLNPSRVGALAALGLTDVQVFAQPTVAILSTGNEIVAPGQPLAPGQIYDINRFTLSAIVAEHGAVAVPFPAAEDSMDALDRAIDDCLACDVMVFSGGSSVGDRDLLMDAVQRRGRVLFHGVAVKPGKPTVFGLIEGKPVFGLPGYPTSCLSNGYIMLAPALRHIARLPPARPKTIAASLARRIVSVTGRHQFYTVRLENGRAVPAFKASGDITSMSKADGYIEIAANTDIVEAGELVDVVLF
jgi:molybdopterin molybdotransferase